MKSVRTNEQTVRYNQMPAENEMKKFRPLGRIILCLMLLLALAAGLAPVEPAPEYREAAGTPALISMEAGSGHGASSDR